MLEKKLKGLPKSYGIYKFLDKEGGILYIGKANNLRSRVASYFNSKLLDRPRVKLMIPLIHDIQVIQTTNEVESLVLESSLIKKYKPKYNSDLKDDKSYSWIFVTTKERFPKVKIIKNINSEVSSNGKLYGPYPSGRAVRNVFTYLRKLFPFCTCRDNSKNECLYYHIGLCPGPYHGHISERDYRKNINGIINFLEGRSKNHIANLEKKMIQFSKLKNYEEAAKLRDRIADLKYISESVGLVDDEENFVKHRDRLSESFKFLGVEIGIKNLRRIECYDISNVQGKEAYGSMTVAENGVIIKSEYRIFRIREINTPNDPEMLKEVLGRRFSESGSKKFPNLPDIVLVDGGKSQLSVIRDVVPKGVFLLGISKGKRIKRSGGKITDEFWYSNNNEIRNISIHNSNILVNLRDEAHRFAILHHRKAMRKNLTRSVLNKIEGVGSVRRKMLLRKFGSVAGIKKSSTEEIQEVVKNREIAERIHRTLNT